LIFVDDDGKPSMADTVVASSAVNINLDPSF
jgi:hypothetical protein